MPYSNSKDTHGNINRRTALSSTAALVAGGLLGRNAFAADDVKIGWIQATTGPLASSFGPLYLAADMALDEINAAGGVLGRKLVKVTADDQGSPAQEPIATRRLIEDGCKFIVGPVGSSQALAYALKNRFTRRVSVQVSRAGRNQHQNTRTRELRSHQHVEIALLLDSAGFGNRLFLRRFDVAVSLSGRLVLRPRGPKAEKRDHHETKGNTVAD